ncbi:tRNA lysidine(34) synthetase TilS [Campylobacter concisus]|uniref:tRNA(Ile)-lysidine synthase n=1 Tax=Campylobacter concisus (strain 13826) TaxID=360104 RepID=A7ZE22_CAMC1|nr:tRNA lysidine(34) synthetase TilS [Campylobacter concisus]EAT97407.1 tRNA(Ile)-lysidine synthetase [Campylobacter concisus 13826]
MISQNVLGRLSSGANLLAFSHGIDSTALFYILKETGVKFDLVIVDHNVREQSKFEVESAKELASKFGKKIYVKSVNLAGSNFEKNAREARYEFFSEICQKFGYENLILAHQFDDKFEWFLMQLGKGAGLKELFGMSELEKREHFWLVRPLLNLRKKELQNYLDERGLRYFVDETNLEGKLKRSFVRLNFSEPFLDEYFSGVKKSFEFLEADRQNLLPNITKVDNEIFIIKNDNNVVRGIDMAAKELNVLLSKAQKDELSANLAKQTSVVLSGKIAVGYANEYILVTPFCKAVMPKEFKERARIFKIPATNRGYLFTNGAQIENLSKFFSK